MSPILSEGNRIHYTLDAIGNRTAEEVFDPSNSLRTKLTRQFSGLSRMIKEIGAAGTGAVTTGFEHNTGGNLTKVSEPLGRTTQHFYDEFNRVTRILNPMNGSAWYAYNALDQFPSVKDPRNRTTAYTYNALGDLLEQTSPDTGTTVNTYDSAGNLKTRTDARGKTGTYDYDALNRVTSLSYSDQTIGYIYDTGTNQKGRLKQVSDASGSTSWTYDAMGRVLTRQQTMASIAKSIGYAFDAAGRLETLTLPSGNTVAYGYTDGKVTSLTLNGSTTILSSVLYQPFGPPTGWSWGNSTLAVREYDQDGKITDLDSADSRPTATTMRSASPASRMPPIQISARPTATICWIESRARRVPASAKAGPTMRTAIASRKADQILQLTASRPRATASTPFQAHSPEPTYTMPPATRPAMARRRTRTMMREEWCRQRTEASPQPTRSMP